MIEIVFVSCIAVTSVCALLMYCSVEPECPVPSVTVDSECCTNKVTDHS